METVGDRIKKRRLELGMTQEELAFKLGYKSKSSVNKMEKNLTDPPLPKIEQFASALLCEPSYLMGWKEDDEKIDSLKTYRKYHEKIKEEFEGIEKFTNAFRQLNPINAKRTYDYMRVLLSAQQMEETALAAHERTDTEVSAKDIEHDVEIMKDDKEW